jgi:hypothetical protein
MSEKQIELIPISLQDLREIKENANRHFFNDTKPNDYEGGDFLTQCYLKGIIDIFNKKGIKVDAYITTERIFVEPIE